MTTIASSPGTGAERLEGRSAAEAPTAEQLAEKAHVGIDQAAAGVAEAERAIRRAAADTAERLRRSETELAELLDQNLKKVREYIENNPIQSAGIAFAAGVVLSSLLRR